MLTIKHRERAREILSEQLQRQESMHAPLPVPCFCAVENGGNNIRQVKFRISSRRIGMRHPMVWIALLWIIIILIRSVVGFHQETMYCPETIEEGYDKFLFAMLISIERTRYAFVAGGGSIGRETANGGL